MSIVWRAFLRIVVQAFAGLAIATGAVILMASKDMPAPSWQQFILAGWMCAIGVDIIMGMIQEKIDEALTKHQGRDKVQ